MWWESDVMKQWKNLLLVAYVFNVYIFMRNVFLWKWGFRSFQNWYIKLFASNDKQIDNHTSMPDMFHSNMSVVCTCHCRGVFKNIFWYGCCSLLIFVAKKAIKGTELQFLCTQGTLLGGRVEDHRMMFTRHLHLVESMIQWFMENMHTELRVLGCKGLKTSYNHICRVLLECMIHTFKQHSTYMIIWCL